MHFIITSLSLLAAAAGAFAALSTENAWDECKAHLNGQLPYYVPPNFHFSGTVRRYYVAAEIVTWDYAPTGWDNWLGVPMNEGYTDATFEERSEQPPWLGFQGPILRAEVGDMIEIMFVNKMEHFFSSMHSMGLFYTKESEGSVYYNGTSSVAIGDAVPPGGCFVLVQDNVGPSPGSDSQIWSYHPYVSMYQDQDAGGFGPVIIYNPGKMESVMAQNREFVLLYSDNQESNSFLALHNVRKYLPSMASQVANLSDEYPEVTQGLGNRSVWYPQFINTPKTNVTSEMAASFFPLNGYIFANNPPFEMCVNDNVIWYLYNMGFDTHVFHLHGDNVLDPVTNATTASVTINPGQMITVLMTAVNPGWWQLICHFTTHLSKGMEANYIVYGGPYGECPLEPLQKP
ncbi:putative multicopper oxidase [Thermoascus aurantiacus ATCC 26904]